ncbi:hypothetical protein [Paenibacillus tengchongensis]|uniref:hypothetical protein n=1 Tax=Paenibacillus tengchongensis TaxID=2608684 RepID=UPI00124E6432|nr:hypothetical protein [Paenibacillus tengchongensis]
MKYATNQFIKRYGIKVTLRRWEYGQDAVTRTSHILIGRGRKKNTPMHLLQSLREGIFPADVDIDNGYFIEDAVRDETFMVCGMRPGYGKGGMISIAANLLLCNSRLELRRVQWTGDERGNLIFGFKQPEDWQLPCCIREVNHGLQQFDAGVLSETEYLVYTPRFFLMETDQIMLENGGKYQPYKVLFSDESAFPGMMVLQVARDTRK